MGEEISTSYKEGSSTEISLHDGSKLALEKTDANFDPKDAGKALNFIREKEEEGKVLTGLLYINDLAKDLNETLNVTQTPLSQLQQDILCPGSEILDEINQSLS